MKRYLSLSLLSLLSVSWSQQMADPDFDAGVKHPTFTTKKPRILFDEAHNNFHTATGRYKPFADLLRNDGCDIASNKSSFSAETLKGYDILVISNARSSGTDKLAAAFKPDEMIAVEKWVREGGSLLLIADHAPFGYNAAALSDKFGVAMGKGYTNDDNNCFQQNGTFLMFSKENGLLGDHPITQGCSKIVAFTGQSLSIPKGAMALMKLSDSATDSMPIFDGKSADGQVKLAPPVSAKGRAQGIAMDYGKGRLVVLGEAGMLSAQKVVGSAGTQMRFGMNVAGIDNRQFALNLAHWLARH